MIDGVLMPQSILQTAQAGQLNGNQILVSSNTGDGIIAMAAMNNGAEMTYSAQQFYDSLTTEFGTTAGSELYALYNPLNYPKASVQAAILDLRTDFEIMCKTENILNAQVAANPNTQVYRAIFNGHILGSLETPISGVLDLASGVLSLFSILGLPTTTSTGLSTTALVTGLSGIFTPSWPAIHGFDVPYVFQQMGSLYSGMKLPVVASSDLALQRTMLDYWTSFAASGVPQSTSQPVWPRYKNTNRLSQILSAPVTTQSNYHGGACSVYNSIVVGD